ncbi:hypothetical protein OH687_21850 [Burkholderia anthina]|nr:hypothetical protein OH687_21850 [Burkholderia anthina]
MRDGMPSRNFVSVGLCGSRTLVSDPFADNRSQAGEQHMQ